MRGAALALALAALGVARWSWPMPAVAGEPVAANNCETECLQYVSRPIPLSKLQNYKNMTCKAKKFVILTTKENRTFCAKPEDSWVQNRIKELAKRNSPPSIKPAPNTKVAVAGSTLQPESTPNVNVVSKITDDPKRFGEILTSVKEGLEETTRDLVASPTILGTLARSTLSGRFASEHPTGSPAQTTLHPSNSSSSRLITGFMGKEMETSPTSARLLTSSSRQSAAPNDSIAESGTQSTVSSITVPQGRGYTDQSSTHSSTVGSKTSSVDTKDMSGAMSSPAIALGDASGSPLSPEANRDTGPVSPGTSPDSGFYQEKFIQTSTAQAMGNTPEVTLTLPIVLAGFIITLVSLAGALCLASTVIRSTYAKSHLFISAPPKEMAQGLLYSPSDPQADTYAMQVL